MIDDENFGVKLRKEFFSPCKKTHLKPRCRIKFEPEKFYKNIYLAKNNFNKEFKRIEQRNIK